MKEASNKTSKISKVNVIMPVEYPQDITIIRFLE